MAKDLAPRVEITVDPTRGEYTDAMLIAARQNGALHSAPVIVVLAAALLAVGMFSFGWFRSALIPLVICLCGPLLLLLFFGMKPSGVRRRAARDYETWRSLMQPAVMRLYADEMKTGTPQLCFTDPYALMALCVETPTQFVLFRDRDRLLVLPKRCIPEEQREETIAFLRLTFTRRRKVMRNWLF